MIKKIIEKKQARFPNKGISSQKVDKILKLVVKDLESWKLENKIGAQHVVPHPASVNVWKELLSLNPNNLGNWSLASQKNLESARKIERKLIFSLINLYGGKQKDWEGYVTSGTTEANIFSAWIGRKVSETKYAKNQISLIVTDLAHYSLIKTADVTGLKLHYTAIDRKTWSINLPGLVQTIEKLKRKGYRGFLLPLTLGYTQTGTDDDYQEITKILTKLQKELKISIYIWIDAALNGLVLPFSQKSFTPLNNPRVQTIAVDFHKSGMVPLPCGVILYRKNLRKFIEKQIPYIYEDDNTLLGSRSGISPVAAYAVVAMLGKKGFRQVVNEGQKEREKFEKQVQKKFPEIEIVSNENGTSIGLVSKKPLPQRFADANGLYSKKKTYRFDSGKENLYIYKASFLYRKKRQ